MSNTVFHILITASFLIISPIYCGVQVIPEKAKVISVNEKYIKDFSFNVRRYSRRGAYYINAKSTLKEEWNNNVTFNLVFYEFLHNEYRRSFVEVHYKFCDMLKTEKFIAPSILKYGITCPLPPGPYRFMNMSFPMDEFPNVFPFEKARLDVEYAVTATGETLLRVYLDASFKNKISAHTFR